MIVTNATVFDGNPYHKLIYSALNGRYEAVKGSVQDARVRLQRSEGRILHIHWEESPLRKCASDSEARLIAEQFAKSLFGFKAAGGKVVWTLHNEWPHEMEFVDHLKVLRQDIAEAADCILIHNLAAATALQKQVHVKASKLMRLPHPSYAGMYPGEHAPRNANKGEILFFGLLRAYKGLDFLIDAIPEDEKIAPNFKIKVRGDVIASDPYAQTVEVYGSRQDVDLVIDRVSDEEVAPMFKTAGAVILPYQRFLTSGVALLALTFGVPVIAPDTPQMRELLPAENHPLLFKQDDPDALKAAVKLAAKLTKKQQEEIMQASLLRAADVHPDRISKRLGDIYEMVLSK